MNRLVSIALLLVATGCLAASTTEGNPVVSHVAKGTFDVKITPQDDRTGDPRFGHLLLDKTLHGDLEATSHGQMLSAMTEIEGSGGYVAIERVNGALHGRTGSFVLIHRGTMRAGEFHMSVIVLPDSGTGELTGIEGTMTIVIEGKQHSYVFEYSLET